MTLAVSNIAWDPTEEADVAATLQKLGVAAVEIAPTKVFADPLAATDAQIAKYTRFWADHGVTVVAFQSMLFGRGDLQVFAAPEVRRTTFERLAGFIQLAGAMAATTLVFGSPKNRQVPPGMTPAQAHTIAVDFFGGLGRIAEAHGTCFAIEPNPPVYDCNFVTTAEAGLTLVKAVNTPGFRLHLDAAGMTLAGDDLGTSITAAAPWLQHFHISAPQLGEIETDFVDHTAAASALRATGYTGNTSIEMRPGHSGEGTARVTAAVALARRFYAAPPAPRVAPAPSAPVNGAHR